MVSIRTASTEDIRILAGKLLPLLTDHKSDAYRENIAKFGIPDEYVKKVFAEQRLVDATGSGKTVFYIALEKKDIIGFAQTIRNDEVIVELDRIFIFPGQTRKGIGTLLLKYAVRDQKRRGQKTMIVTAGRDEFHARSFYEKNGFEKQNETTVQTPWGTKMDFVTYSLDLG
jgi:N-acetylglutamate synthase-like GNAT family acetyltransferase